MLSDITKEAALSSILTGRGKISGRVMEAMKNVPRDQFLPEELAGRAFSNGPLPIGYGQTISQPFIVALMTDLLNIDDHSTVLEIGTGSGYQSAVLSLLAKTVYTVEVIRALSEQAEARFKALQFSNIKTRVGNGYAGWIDNAPYDGIIVTAAAVCIPDALIKQLKPDGRLVIPVGSPYDCQELVLVEKNPDGKDRLTKVLDVAFVPMVDTPETEP